MNHGTPTIVVEERDAQCERHGPYSAKLASIRDVSRWTGCPHCAKEAIDRAQDEREARQGDDLLAAKGAALHDASGAPHKLMGATLKNYRIIHGDKQESALRVCCEYVRNFAQHRANGQGLVMMGTVGTGKSHLACGILRHITRKQGVAGRYIRAMALFTRVKASYGNGGENEADIIQEYATAPLLVIDELGIGRGSDTELNILYSILGHRYDECLPTILTTNATHDELHAWLGDRVLDRLRETSRVVICDWPSYRGGAL